MQLRTVVMVLIVGGVVQVAGAVPAQDRAQTPGSDESVAAALSEAIRPTLETSLREIAGIGFATFACHPPGSFEPPMWFDCEGVDEEGDRFVYTLELAEEGGGRVVRTSQPFSQLEPAAVAAPDAACRGFLGAYGRRQWDELFAGLHPDFSASDSAASLGARLDGVRSLFGAVEKIEPTAHAVSFEGANELEYLVHSENGVALARFGVAPAEDGRWAVTAFLVTARPGSAEQAMLLRRTGAEVLSRAIGAPVVRIEAPFERLHEVGDAVEGTAWVEDGRAVPVMIDQHGWSGDFDATDFRFFVLDSALVVRRGLEQQSGGVQAVECADAVVPDGGQTRCTATIASGERVELVLSRQGGEHRLRGSGGAGS